jgi:hypothetical protein
VGGFRSYHTQPRPHSQQFPFVFAFKETLASQKFQEDEELKNEVIMWLCVQAAEFCDMGIQQLVPRVNKCLDKGGDCVEK